MVHEVHCQRNFYRCVTCGATMDKRLRESHDSTAHVPTPCPHCRTQMPAYQLPSHKCRKAPNPPKACTFCQAEIAYEDYVDHVKDCGSRTQQCPTCQEYVQSWEFDKHIGICVANPPIERPQRAANRPYATNVKARVNPGKVGVSRAKPGLVTKPGARPAKPGLQKKGGTASKPGPASAHEGDDWTG